MQNVKDQKFCRDSQDTALLHQTGVNPLRRETKEEWIELTSREKKLKKEKRVGGIPTGPERDSVEAVVT